MYILYIIAQMDWVCVYPSLYESLLLLNASTDLHQICCEGQPTSCPEIDGGGGRSPPVGAAKLPHRRTGEARPQGAAKPPPWWGAKPPTRTGEARPRGAAKPPPAPGGQAWLPPGGRVSMLVCVT